MPDRDSPSQRDRGSGLIGTTAGLVVFLVLMLAAVQILFTMYASSAVTAASHDAARRVAGFDSADDRCAAAAAATLRFRDQLGRYADAADVALELTCGDPDVVEATVVAAHHSIVPSPLGGLIDLDLFDRKVSVRVENPR